SSRLRENDGRPVFDCRVHEKISAAIDAGKIELRHAGREFDNARRRSRECSALRGNIANKAKAETLLLGAGYLHQIDSPFPATECTHRQDCQRRSTQNAPAPRLNGIGHGLEAMRLHPELHEEKLV